ncbi:hypothetical protein CDV36_011349 [Fusarium kuroshium]|uniref:Uncharacterized protein n=1 Tax=Fusarium kuroshium TaxID=2010991 RepID=A0A3M2RUP0_9HYPO|nr:hypothetical protein CDV36_011349 [Fusarium kuroshium]
MMVHTWGEGSNHTQNFDSSSVSPQLVTHLHEQLQFYKDKAQKLEAEVQHLKEELALRHGPAPRPPVSCQLSIQKPPSPITIAFRIENPQLQQNNAITSDKPPELADLLKRVPKADEAWCLRRKELQLDKPEEVIGTFMAFVFRAQPAVISGQVRDQSRPPTDTGRLEDFKAFVRGLRRESERATQLYYFAELLFVSLCRVASMNGASRDTIDSLMDDFLPSTRKGKQKRQFTYLSHLRASVLWPIHQAELLRKKFKHRADEFFLLYGPTVTKYRQLHENKNTQKFADLAKLPPPPREGEFSSDISFAIPLMMTLIVGDRYKSVLRLRQDV